MCVTVTGTYGIEHSRRGGLRTGATAIVTERFSVSLTDSFLSSLGGGDGVVCSVVVERTGLVVLDPSDLLEVEESSLPSSLIRLSFSSLRKFPRRSSQSTPSNHTASSLSSCITSSSDMRAAFIAGSTPSAPHSMTSLRTTFFSAGSSTARICL